MSQGKGSKRRYDHGNKSKINVGDKGREILESIDENNPVIQQFRSYAAMLDDKHDRHERLVKLSRDITIESKRIIFLLHTIDRESKRDSVLTEAKLRLDNVGKTQFKNIALELVGHDPYQYIWAFKFGFQEYVEALTFYQYLKNNTMPHWADLEKALTYTVPTKTSSSNKDEGDPPDTRNISTLVVPSEFVLGIADLTGELMRKCINNLAGGDIPSCYNTRNFVRETYKGFLSFSNIFNNKEMNKKLYTMKQSLGKMENVCYTIKIRGSEIPKHMLALVATQEFRNDDDEGYQVY